MPSLKTQIRTACSVIKPISMELNNMQMKDLASHVFGTSMTYWGGRNRLRWYLYTNSKRSSLDVFVEWYELGPGMRFTKENRSQRQDLRLGIFEEPKVLEHPVAVLILEQAVRSAQRLSVLARSQTHALEYPDEETMLQYMNGKQSLPYDKATFYLWIARVCEIEHDAPSRWPHIHQTYTNFSILKERPSIELLDKTPGRETWLEWGSQFRRALLIKDITMYPIEGIVLN